MLRSRVSQVVVQSPWDRLEHRLKVLLPGLESAIAISQASATIVASTQKCWLRGPRVLGFTGHHH